MRVSGERPVYTLRIATNERRFLEAAAAEGGQSLAQFIRVSALCAARRQFVEGMDPSAGRSVAESVHG